MSPVSPKSVTRPVDLPSCTAAKGALSCQHSRVDAPFLAEIAVRLRCGGVTSVAAAIVS